MIITATFHIHEHRIEIQREFTSLKFVVDGEVKQERQGLFNHQLTSSVFTHTIIEDENVLNIVVKTKIGVIVDEAILFCNDKEIETQKFL